jgi:hypothetical protein
MNDRLEVTRHGERKNGEAYSDTFEINAEQLKLLKQTVNDEISRIEEKIGYRWREPWKTRREALIELICIIDQ